MIVPMKKVSIIVMDKNKDIYLEKIRDLSLVHIEKKEVQSERLSKLFEDKGQVERANAVITSFAPKKGQAVVALPHVTDLSSYVLELADKKKSAQDKLFNNSKEISRIEKWGDFDPAAFKAISGISFAGATQSGDAAKSLTINIKVLVLVPYELSQNAYENLKENKDVNLIVLKKDKYGVLCVSVGSIEGEQPFVLPEQSLSALKKEQEALLKTIADIEKELTSLYPQVIDLKNELARVNQDIEFETAKIGMDNITDVPNEFSVSWITGFVPVSEIGLLKRAAAENSWALYADDPAEDDPVPTKLKNNKLVSLIYPLTDFLETVPGYRETDISGVFLLFFCIFFGMLFGDAGYGLVLAAIGIIGMIKTAKKGIPAGFKLLMLLAISNTAWGLLTCTWFGIDVAILPQFLKSISLYPISNVTAALDTVTCSIVGSKETLTLSGATYVSQNLQVFCFSLALIQLTFAHTKGIIGTARAKSLKAFAELGSIAMLWGMFALILYLVVNNTRFPFVGPQYLNIVLGLIGGGFAINFVFAGYEGSLIGSIVNSLKNIISVVLGLTNVFSDIMSYIRLWAVGLAGASISATVNSMAGPLLGNFLIFLGIILLVFGHTLNMVLNTLSVLVHGVRLNTLEFSGHIGLTWSGIAYKPFKATVQK